MHDTSPILSGCTFKFTYWEGRKSTCGVFNIIWIITQPNGEWSSQLETPEIHVFCLLQHEENHMMSLEYAADLLKRLK